MAFITFVVCQLVIVIHFNGIKGAELGAVATVHANVGVNVELGRLWNGLARFWIVGAHNPDALGRANFGANTAAGANSSMSSTRPQGR